MGKKLGNFAIVFVVCFCLLVLFILSGCHSTTKEFGGEMTIELEPDQKLELITWKDDSLWLLTRPMREDEHAETHTYYEDSEWGVFEGPVTIVEKED